MQIQKTTLYSDDLTKIKPWKIKFGNLIGKEEPEIALGIYKETPLHKKSKLKDALYTALIKKIGL